MRFSVYCLGYFEFYYIHFEITGYPCNVIGSQRCDLFPNRTIFCSKYIDFKAFFKLTNHITYYLLTESEVMTGKSQTEALMYWYCTDN